MFYKNILKYLHFVIITIILLLDCTPFSHVPEDDFISSDKKDDNGEWQWYFVDGGGDNGINENPSMSATYPQLTVYNSQLYATWKEDYEIKIAVYNGDDNNPVWSIINYSINGSYPQLTVFNSKLYLTYIFGNPNKVYVAVYNGDNNNPSWSLVSNSGLNKDINKYASNPQLISFNSKLYAIWLEDITTTYYYIYNVRVAVYNGDDNNPSWSFVDGNGTNGLNKDPNEAARCSQFAVFNSKLYVIWQESNTNPVKIYVAVYNGDDNNPSWSFIENNGNEYLNKDITETGREPQLTVFNSELYAIWSEFYENQDGQHQQVTVAKYNGDGANPSWQYVDSDDVYGINKNIKNSGVNPQLTALNSKLFAIWEELGSSPNSQIRVAMFNGENKSPMWSFVDGDTAYGINKDYNKRALRSQLTAYNSKLYAIWQEDLAPGQIRVKVYKK